MDVERDLWRVNALSTGCKTRLASPVTLYVQVGGWSKGSFTCGQARLNLHHLICLGRCLFIFQHCNRFLRSDHNCGDSHPRRPKRRQLVRLVCVGRRLMWSVAVLASAMIASAPRGYISAVVLR